MTFYEVLTKRPIRQGRLVLSTETSIARCTSQRNAIYIAIAISSLTCSCENDNVQFGQSMYMDLDQRWSTLTLSGSIDLSTPGFFWCCFGPFASIYARVISY